MKAIKRLFLKMILSKNQREVIWNAILCSEYKYKQHGDTENAIRVGVVKEEVKKIFYSPKTKYTAKEVDKIVASAIGRNLDCVSDLIQKRVKELNENKCQMTHLVPGVIISREKCEQCEHKDDCGIKKVVFDDDSDAQSETTQEQEKAGEQVAEASEQEQKDSEQEKKQPEASEAENKE